MASDLRHMTTGEADAFREGLRRGAEIGLEAAARECDRQAQFVASGGAHLEGCTSINGALWYGRHQYAETCAAAIRAIDTATLVPGE